MASGDLSFLTGGKLGKRGTEHGTGELQRGPYGAGSTPNKNPIVPTGRDVYYNPSNRPGSRFGRGGIGVHGMMRSFGIDDSFSRNPTGQPGVSPHLPMSTLTGSRLSPHSRPQRPGAPAPSSPVIDAANLGAPSPGIRMQAIFAANRAGAAMHTSNTRAFSGPGLLQRGRNYVQAGGMMQAGFERIAGQHAAGQNFYRWGNSFYRTGATQGVMGPQILGNASVQGGNLMHGGNAVVSSPNGRPLSTRSVSMFGKSVGTSALMSGAGVAGSAYYMYLGYKGEVTGHSGMHGVFDAGTIDLATMSGVARFSSVATAVGAGVATKKLGFMRTASVFLAASVGASMGHGAMGIPGSFAGGYVGASLGRAPLRLAAAGAVVGGTVAVGKGGYNLLKTGYRKRAASRGIDTAGDMASFYTQNAMTMRSRAVSAIRNSHTNARSALGQEASFMHTNKNYFSPYRR